MDGRLQKRDMQLVVSLCGADQQVLGLFSSFAGEEYESLTASLEERFDPKKRVQLYRCEFRNKI